MREYSIPKHTLMAAVIFPGHPAIDVTLFLGEGAAQHSGPERPSDLLNGPDPFLPALDRDENLVFLNAETARMISFAAEDERAGVFEEDLDFPPNLVARIEVLLDDGSLVKGTVRSRMPEAHCRVQDHLNTAGRFLMVQEDDLLRFINTRCIASVRMIEEMRGRQ